MAGRSFALFAACLLLLGAGAYAQDLLSEFDETFTWVADLSYENEVPVPAASEATGIAYYTLIDTPESLAINFTVFLQNYVVGGVSDDNRTVLFAHIHAAPPGVNGPILVVLYSDPLGGPATLPTPVTDDREFLLAQGTITPASLALPGWTFDDLLEAMDNGTLYTNVHSSKYPGGEVRGQIYPVLVEEPVQPVNTQSI